MNPPRHFPKFEKVSVTKEGALRLGMEALKHKLMLLPFVQWKALKLTDSVLLQFNVNDWADKTSKVPVGIIVVIVGFFTYNVQYALLLKSIRCFRAWPELLRYCTGKP